jgi:hypothetical protein
MLLYNELARQIVETMAQRVRDLRHIDPERIGILAAARCSGGSTGNLATCYGLNREQNPTFSIWTRPRSRQIIAISEWFQYRSPRIRLGGRDMTYLILLRLPRLLLRNPLTTLVHELYHISVKFDSSMRPARHGPTFNREVRRIANDWLARQRGELARLAQMRHHELQREYGAVLALSVPSHFCLPLLEPIELPAPALKDILHLYPGYTLAPRFKINPAPVAPEDAPLVLTDKDLVLRHYSRTGSERIPTVLARYSQRQIALSAG